MRRRRDTVQFTETCAQFIAWCLSAHSSSSSIHSSSSSTTATSIDISSSSSNSTERILQRGLQNNMQNLIFKLFHPTQGTAALEDLVSNLTSVTIYPSCNSSEISLLNSIQADVQVGIMNNN